MNGHKLVIVSNRSGETITHIDNGPEWTLCSSNYRQMKANGLLVNIVELDSFSDVDCAPCRSRWDYCYSDERADYERHLEAGQRRYADSLWPAS